MASTSYPVRVAEVGRAVELIAIGYHATRGNVGGHITAGLAGGRQPGRVEFRASARRVGAPDIAPEAPATDAVSKRRPPSRAHTGSFGIRLTLTVRSRHGDRNERRAAGVTKGRSSGCELTGVPVEAARGEAGTIIRPRPFADPGEEAWRGSRPRVRWIIVRMTVELADVAVSSVPVTGAVVVRQGASRGPRARSSADTEATLALDRGPSSDSRVFTGDDGCAEIES